MPSFNTLQLIGLSISALLLITSIVLLVLTVKMKIKSRKDDKIKIDKEINEVLDRIYFDCESDSQFL